MNHLDTPDSFRQIVSKLEIELQSKIKVNTDFSIDKALYKAQQGDIDSRDWLVLNFLPLIIKTIFTNSFHLRNAYTAKSHTYTFHDRDNELEVEDLFFHLIVKFKESIEQYTWDTVFNSWIQHKLKWACVNYRLKIQKNRERELSLDDIMHDRNNDNEDDESIDRMSSLSEDNQIWSSKTNFVDVLLDSDLMQLVDEYVEEEFEDEYKRVYVLYFKEDLNILDIAQRFRLKYHSKITHMVKILKESILSYLSQLDPAYKPMYDAYMSQQNGTNYSLSEDTDMNCEDLMPQFDTDHILKQINQDIMNGASHE